MTREDTLSRLLHKHADTITPAPGLGRIRARIAEGRPWWRRAWGRATGRGHVCAWRPDAIDIDTVRCWCGARPTTPFTPLNHE